MSRHIPLLLVRRRELPGKGYREIMPDDFPVKFFVSAAEKTPGCEEASFYRREIMRKRWTNSLTGIVCCFLLLVTACGGGGGDGSDPSGPVAAPPTVTTLAATSVGATSATLNGNVTANGLATTVWFEYDTDPTLALLSYTSTPSQSVGSGTTTQLVNAGITGLTAGTTYYYRVAARNSSGTRKGSINILTSSTPPLPPAINVNSDNVSFGDVVLDNFSDDIITVGNTGGLDLAIGQIAQANPLASPFSIANDLCSGKTLKTSQTCTLHVQFYPTIPGNGLNDTFDIPSNDPNKNPVNVSVSGNGKSLRVTVNQVNTDFCPSLLELLVAVADKDGNPISGLDNNNFVLSEDGVPKDISSVVEHIQLPVSVALVLDVSGSMSSVITDVKNESKAFVDLLNTDDAASISTFAADIKLEQSFTTNKNVLKSAIDNITLRPDWGSLMYDALRSAIDNLVTQANSRAIILISDGIDTGNGSFKTPAEVISYANEKGVPIFTIGIGDVNTDAMSQLASNTGGQFFIAANTDQLAGIYQAIKNIITGRYTIQYNSSSTASNPVMLNLKVINHDGREGEASMQLQGCP
jgi:VWFA-related protein